MINHRDNIPKEPFGRQETPEKKQRKISKPIHLILEGNFLSREGVIRNLPFILYLAFIAMIYIGNTYYAEKTWKEIEGTKRELKELRYRYIQAKSTLMVQSKQSTIAKRASLLGLTETKSPPYKIFYSPGPLPITHN